jgi:demethylmenaquinone methyltransferase/2-methoxy-6-polyprenyl-1,4-benzoquinol methylase
MSSLSRQLTAGPSLRQQPDTQHSAIFDTLAPGYGRLQDVHSMGLHRYWRRVLVKSISPHPGQRILDLAGGQGEMARRLSAADRQVFVVDSSLPMIEAGRAFGTRNVVWIAGAAQALPFADASVDAVVCAFGIRNLTCVEAALAEVRRVLKPAGRFYCLEVSRPWPAVLPLYRAFCRYLVPRLGACVFPAPDVYDYLVGSLLQFPGRKRIASLLETVGFRNVRCRRMTMGVVCIHTGTRE